jgi:hypothetical protein
VVAFAVSCAGCDQLQALFGGAPSTKVFFACVERGKKDGMDAVTTKNFCINKYQGKIADREAMDGTAYPTDCAPEDDIAWINKKTSEISKDMTDLIKTGVTYSSTDFDVVVLNKAEPRKCNGFEFKLKNASKEYVVTTVELGIKNLRTGRYEDHNFEAQWIEPSKETLYKVKLNNPFSQANYDDKLKGQFEWGVNSTKGFKMNY